MRSRLGRYSMRRRYLGIGLCVRERILYGGALRKKLVVTRCQGVVALCQRVVTRLQLAAAAFPALDLSPHVMLAARHQTGSVLIGGSC